MGKGDKKTAKGKRSIASHGNARPKGAGNKAAEVSKAPAAKKTAVKKKA